MCPLAKEMGRCAPTVVMNMLGRAVRAPTLMMIKSGNAAHAPTRVIKIHRRSTLRPYSDKNPYHIF